MPRPNLNVGLGDASLPAGAAGKSGSAAGAAAVRGTRLGVDHRQLGALALPSRDNLDADSASVLGALPGRVARGPRRSPSRPESTSIPVLRCLGLLAGYGFIERCDRGWRLRKLT